MANNPYVNKVVYGGVTLIDTSGVTVTADKLAKGYTALDSSGALIVGTANLGGETVWYGKCLTSSGVQTKTVTISGITELYEGLSVRINFVNGQDFDGIPMLNINSLGAKIVIRNANTGAAQYEWADGEVLDFVYDGNYWVIVNGGNIKIGGSGSLLPSEYTQVEYIGAESANPYINTGL